ncbi:MAG: hypothetical protein WHS44_05125 [Fimbriimonadales bacterium]
MMTQAGEPWGYYPQDSNGLAVQSAPAEPCACPVFAPTNVAVCSPLVDGGCGGSVCDVSPATFGIDITKCLGGKKDKKKTYQMCVDFCKVFANAYCKGAGFGIDPRVGRICDLISKKGCEAICKDIHDRKYFTDCWTPCLETTQPGSPKCAECCNELCKDKEGGDVQKGGLAICYKRCATAPERD